MSRIQTRPRSRAHAGLLAFPAVPGVLAALVVALAVLAAVPAACAPAPLTEKAAAAAEAAEPAVTLYATSWCGWCRKTRALLDELGVEYADLDIEEDGEAAREHREKAGRGAGVPVLDIDGTIVRGYDEAKIRRLVAQLDDDERGGRRRG